MFSITQFKNSVRIVRPNQFFAEVNLPSKLQTAINSRNSTQLGGSFSANPTWSNALRDSNLNSTFRLRCEMTEFPGRTIATFEDSTFGPTTKLGYDVTYNDISMTIIAAEDMRERSIFEVWMENIVNNSNRSTSSTGVRGGMVKYYDDYASGTVTVYQVNEKSEQLAKCTLYGAYPIGIGPLNLSWEEYDSYQRFVVTIAYRYHIVDFQRKTISV
jgi:hypothetical protein